MEMDQMPIQQQFEEVIVSDNLLEVKEFLNNQNISDVANLIYENPDYEIQIISTLSIHRSNFLYIFNCKTVNSEPSKCRPKIANPAKLSSVRNQFRQKSRR